MNYKDFNQRLVDILESGMTHSLSFELRRLSSDERRELISFYQSIKFDETEGR